MSSRRVLKAAQAIREVVSMAIITDIKDPRVKDVTVTFVEVAGDMRMAKVHVSVMGDETKQNLCLKGLQSSVGYLQKKVGNRIDTRYTPRIQFQLDKGLQNAMSVTRILEEVLPAEKTAEAEPVEEGDDNVTGSPEETNPEVNDHV
jgi:ribosome-binding factor A